MVKLRMAQSLADAVKFIEQGRILEYTPLDQDCEVSCSWSLAYLQIQSPLPWNK